MTEERQWEREAERLAAMGRALQTMRDEAVIERDAAVGRAVRAERELAELREHIANEIEQLPTSFNNEANDYGLGWADGAAQTIRRAVHRARSAGSAAGEPT